MATFDKSGARRIAAATRKAERVPRNRAGPPPRPPALPAGARYLLVTTTITLRSGATLGKGAGKLQRVTYDGSDVGTLADVDATSYPIYSGSTASGTTVAAGRYVIAIPIAGRWHVIVDFC